MRSTVTARPVGLFLEDVSGAGVREFLLLMYGRPM
jgi:hypothetical protein